MPVLVDTNVILDVLTDDPAWADWSIASAQKSTAKPNNVVRGKPGRRP